MDCGTPEMTRLLRGLLEGLGVDPNDLEVRIGVRQLGEPGRPRAEDARGPEETETGGFDLTLPSRGEVRGLCGRERPTSNGSGRSDGDPGAEVANDPGRIGNGRHGLHTWKEQRVDGAPEIP
jgi:hypothetical protein